jgi:hypothetical protein
VLSLRHSVGFEEDCGLFFKEAGSLAGYLVHSFDLVPALLDAGEFTISA